MDSEKMGRDRSLGLIDVFPGDYIAQDETGEYLVNDKRAWREDGLKLHGKGMPKGTLTYNVSFYPCINVADPEDEEESADDAGKAPPPTEKKDGVTLEIPAELVPATPTSPKSPVSPKSPMSPRKSREEKAPPLIRLTPQELLRHECGLVIFKLMEAELPKSDTHIEIFVDDMAFPSYVSSTARSRNFKFDEIGDCFVRELDFSRLTVKVRERAEKQDDDKNKTLARLTGNTLDTLKQCLVSCGTFLLCVYLVPPCILGSLCILGSPLYTWSPSPSPPIRVWDYT